MKLVVILSLLGLALGLPASSKVSSDALRDEIYNYHQNVGVKLAAEIKAREEAIDFDGANRIAGGSLASLGQYPHLGGIVIQIPTGLSVCGSSLLSDTRLVTAAHCWFSGTVQAQLFTIVLGSVNLFIGGTRIQTTEVVMHELWRPWLQTNEWIHNDIAIIRIPPVKYSDFILPIYLPTGNLLNNSFAGYSALVVGYGRKGDGNNHNISPVSQPLSHAQVTVTTNAVCQNTYGGAVISSTICIDTQSGQSTCAGDSGGPLQYTYAGENVLLGITSFGHISGCQNGHPAAFARVSSFVPWIKAQL